MNPILLAFFSRNNLLRITDEKYETDLDNKNSKWRYLVSVTHNIFRIKDNESIVCGFYCIAFISLHEMFCEIMLICFLLMTNKKNGKTIYKYVKDKYSWRV